MLTELKQMNLIELIMVMKVKRKTRKMSKHMIIERELKEKMIEKEYLLRALIPIQSHSLFQVLIYLHCFSICLFHGAATTMK